MEYKIITNREETKFYYKNELFMKIVSKDNYKNEGSHALFVSQARKLSKELKTDTAQVIELSIGDTYEDIDKYIDAILRKDETLDHFTDYANYTEILTILGFLSKTPKMVPVKAQHRWRKELSTIPFYVDHFKSKATIFWVKRNEMVIKAGATMLQEAPLNKDGSVGISAKMGNQLRLEHSDKFKDFVTTEDITLKSVNEVSLFLYFAGVNSWLVLKDENGKTIDEYSRVD